MEDELKIGVIGVGGRGSLAEDAHRPGEGVRLVAGADTNPMALRAFKQKYGADVFVTQDYRQLFSETKIDAVFITSPDYLHEEHAVAALRAGKHVYLEKPMAITIEGCDRIMQAAFENGCKLYLGHNMRHMSFITKMKEMIENGAIGRVKAGWCRHFIGYGGDAYFKDWHAEREKTTSLLLQKGAHDIDILHWLCGDYTDRVTALGGLTLYDQVTDRHDRSERGDASWHDSHWPPLTQKGLNPIINVEDLSMVLMHLRNGVLASYQQCHYTPDSWRNYCIIGTEGRLENFGDEPGNCTVRLWNRRQSYNPAGHEQYAIPAAEGTHGGADPRIVAEFIRYVRYGGDIRTSAIAARNSVAVGFCAAQSIRTGGRPMEIPPVPEHLEQYFGHGSK